MGRGRHPWKAPGAMMPLLPVILHRRRPFFSILPTSVAKRGTSYHTDREIAIPCEARGRSVVECIYANITAA